MLQALEVTISMDNCQDISHIKIIKIIFSSCSIFIFKIIYLYDIKPQTITN